MYYVKFDTNNIQEQMMISEENPGAGWHGVGEDIDGKMFKLVSGAPIAMTDEEKDEYYLSLKTNYSYANLRSERNEMLMRSDWTQLSNSGLSEAKKAEWETYRQALRDLPETMTEDLEYTLPEVPA
jgi:hypothetical protein